MIYIVTSDLNRQVPDVHMASFRVDAMALPFVRGELVKHLQICLAQQAKELERFFGVARGILSQSLPKVLVEARQGSAVMLNHLAIAPSTRDLGLGKMRQD